MLWGVRPSPLPTGSSVLVASCRGLPAVSIVDIEVQEVSQKAAERHPTSLSLIGLIQVFQGKKAFLVMWGKDGTWWKQFFSLWVMVINTNRWLRFALSSDYWWLRFVRSKPLLGRSQAIVPNDSVPMTEATVWCCATLRLERLGCTGWENFRWRYAKPLNCGKKNNAMNHPWLGMEQYHL